MARKAGQVRLGDVAERAHRARALLAHVAPARAGGDQLDAVAGERPRGEAASQAVLDHKARLILIAADAGETTARRLKRLESDKLPVLTLPEKKSELGAAVGFADVAAAAVCDLGFACAIAQKLAAEDEGCRDAAERLKARQSKAVRRKADTARHGKKSARRGR